MKRAASIYTILLMAFSLCTGFVTKHEFYVSLAEVRYNIEKKSLEISLRIFPDDMDHALENHYGIVGSLVTEIEHPDADSLLAIYLNKQFSIELDGQIIPLTYLGKEAESDVMWCYLESDQVPLPHEMTVSNSILTEIFRDQVNITQVYVGKWNRGLLLKRGQIRGHLIIGN